MKPPLQKVVSFPTTRWRALLLGLCPRCRSGQIFGGLLHMHESCPSCGLVFEREPGYFSGALFLSHLAGLPLIVLLAGLAILWLGPDASLPLAVLLATIAFTGLSPFLCRIARVWWIHLDQRLDPARRPERAPRRARAANLQERATASG